MTHLDPDISRYGMTLAVLGLCVLGSLYTWLQQRTRFRDKCLPPGPRRLPIIGSLLVMPSDHEWLVYEQWSKEKGELDYRILSGLNLTGKWLYLAWIRQ